MTILIVDAAGVTADVWATESIDGTVIKEVSGFQKVYQVVWDNDHVVTKNHVFRNAYAFMGDATSFVECMKYAPVVNGRLSLTTMIHALRRSTSCFHVVIPTEDGAVVVTTQQGVVTIKSHIFENKHGGMDTLVFGASSPTNLTRSGDSWIGLLLDAHRQGKIPTLDFTRYNAYEDTLRHDRLLSDDESKDTKSRRLSRRRRRGPGR